jgi:hypothetical protein
MAIIDTYKIYGKYSTGTPSLKTASIFSLFSINLKIENPEDCEVDFFFSGFGSDLNVFMATFFLL